MSEGTEAGRRSCASGLYLSVDLGFVVGEGSAEGDLTSRTTLLTVPAASATYTAPSSYGSAIMARILEASRIG